MGKGQKQTKKKESFGLARFRIEQWSNTIVAVAKVAGLVMIFFFLFKYTSDAVIALAGKETEANIFVELIGSMSLPEWLAYGFGAGGSAYGLFQRRQRKSETKRHTEARRQWERRRDPGRSSSGLDQYGDPK